MARPKKIGLEYFPLDCQMDDKVEMLEAEHGLEGFAVYIKLLQAIYQTDTGELDMSIIFRWKTLGKQYGIPADTLKQMVDTMCEVALFDKDIYIERHVLTSSGIQKRITKVNGLRERDRSRKIDAEGELSTGKPSDKYIKGKESKEHTNDVAGGAQHPSKSQAPTTHTAAVLTDPQDEQHWSVGPLTKAKPFRIICERLGFLEIHFEHYRKQALVAAEDANISRTIAQWTSWIRNYLNNQSKNGPLLKLDATLPTEPTPRNQYEEINRAGGVIAIAGVGSDESMNRMKVAQYKQYYPNATIHAIIAR